MLTLGVRLLWFVLLLCLSALPASTATIRVKWNSMYDGPGNDWAHGYRTIGAAIKASTAGTEIWVAGDLRHPYVETVKLPDGVSLYGGFAGTEIARDQRSWAANVTILSGNGYNAVVTLPARASSTTSLDGFRITHTDGGSAVECPIDCQARISHNTLRGNALGINCGLYCRPTITENTIIGGGTGISCNSSSPNIINNTIVGNAENGVNSVLSSPVLTNNIIAFNNTGILQVGEGTPVLTSNCVYNPDGRDYQGLGAGQSDFADDPGLISAEHGQTHLAGSSPCIDAGLDSAVQPGARDMDGQARTIGAHVDIGADEWDGNPWPGPGPVVVRVSPDGVDDEAHDGSDWSLAKRTIQAGINATSETGGDVWVAAGTYTEHVMFPPFVYLYGGFAANELTRDQRDWTVHRSVIDGGGDGEIVRGVGGHRNSTLDGFRVTNGGRGIYLGGSSAIVANNEVGGITGDSGVFSVGGSALITSNTISGNGVGISVQYGSPIVTGNVITLNSDAGIYCQSSGGVIANNKLRGNVELGIRCYTNSSPLIANNDIVGSQSGISCTYMSSPLIVSNVIAGCSSNGIFSGPEPSSVTVTNNTIVGCGSAIGVRDNGGAAISNNILAYNRAGVVKESTTAQVALQNNCLYNPGGTDYSGVTAGPGDIAADPLLVSPEYGRLHIQPDSPCVNSGLDGAVQPDWLDVDGQARTQGGRVDMGADESDGSSWPEHVPAIVRVSPRGVDDEAHDGSSWELAKGSIQAAVLAASAEGGEVWIAAGTYREQVALPAYAYVYGGFKGDEESREARNWSAHPAVIDGGGTGNVVTVLGGGATAVNALDGVRIRNSAWNLSGVRCTGYSPSRLSNLVVSGNGIGITSSSGLISNCQIAANGTGLSCASPGPAVTNNTFAHNAVGISLSANPVLSNNIIALSGRSGISQTGTAAPVLQSNCLFNPGATNYSGLQAGPTDILADPQFASAELGHLNIQPTSPCMDAGLDEAVSAGWRDMDAQPRIQGQRADIGADESDGTIWPAPLPTVVRVSPDGADDYEHDGSSWELAKRTVQAGIEAASLTGGDVWTSEGTYSEHLRLLPYVSVYGGFGGSEIGRDERDPSSRVTTIDGGGAGDVVTAIGAFGGVLDGLHIRNSGTSTGLRGLAGVLCRQFYGTITHCILSTNQYGVFCDDARPRISYNTFTGNETGVYGSGPRSVVVDGNTISGSAKHGIYSKAGSLVVTANTIGASGASGIYFDLTNGTVEANTISGSKADGVHCKSASPTIRANKLIGNGQNGIYCDSSSYPIVGNISAGNGLNGLLLLNCPSSQPVANNTVCDNHDSGILLIGSSSYITNNAVAFSPKGIYKSGTSGKPTLANNCLYNPAGVNYSGLAAGNGDISADPLFAERAAGDYHILSGSPCVNAGLTSAQGLPQFDMDSQGRVFGASVDIGADELWPGQVRPTDAKGAPDQAVIAGLSGIVSAVWPGVFYIEDEARASGIRVEMPGHALTAGKRASVDGEIATSANGEKCVLAQAASASDDDEVMPLMLRNCYLGGGALSFPWLALAQPGIYGSTGLNNIGLLVSTAGRVWAPRTQSGWFYIDDGSGASDGSGVSGIFVDAAGLVAPDTGSFAAVTGISSCDWFDGKLVSTLRPRSQEDIRIVAPQGP